MDPWRTIILPAVGMRCFNPLHELVAPLGLAASRTLPPGVVTAPRYVEHVTYHVHGKLLGMLLNEGEPHGWCLAKKGVAFFKISRSRSTRLFSSRSRLF